MNVLVADIGGTKALVSVYSDRTGYRQKFSERFLCANFSSPLELFQSVLAKTGKVDRCVIAIAGRVENGKCTMTNLGWSLSERDLARQCDIAPKYVRILNDFEAAGNAIPYLTKNDLTVIKRGKNDSTGAKVLMGAGTGLGEAVIVPRTASWIVVASEGGHSDLAPRTGEQWELTQKLYAKNGYRGWEAVLSGPGLEKIYQYISKGKKMAASEITGAVKHDQNASKAIQLFLDFFAQEAQSLALKGKATGGVYLGGGILPKILPSINTARFRKVFEENGKMKKLLHEIPVWAVRAESLEIRGCLAVAQKL